MVPVARWHANEFMAALREDTLGKNVRSITVKIAITCSDLAILEAKSLLLEVLKW